MIKGVCIKIETGDLGQKAGLASVTRAGNIFSVVVDPSRLADPAADLLSVMLHEFTHIIVELADEQRKAKRAQWDTAADYVINEALRTKEIGNG